MKYILYIQNHNGTAELEFDSLKVARAELANRLSFEFSNGSSMDKKGTDDYVVHNYFQGDTHLYIKHVKDTKNMADQYNKHITIAVGNWKNYRVFKSKDALKKYIQAIVAKGFYGIILDASPKTQKIEPQGTTHDIETMYGEIFDFGLTLIKKKANGEELKIHIYETVKNNKKTASPKTAPKKTKTTLSEPVYF